MRCSDVQVQRLPKDVRSNERDCFWAKSFDGFRSFWMGCSRVQVQKNESAEEMWEKCSPSRRGFVEQVVLLCSGALARWVLLLCPEVSRYVHCAAFVLPVPLELTHYVNQGLHMSLRCHVMSPISRAVDDWFYFPPMPL